MKDLDLKLLARVASQIKTGNELMGSKWQNCESEVVALQTIFACARNQRQHGEAISWQGKNTQCVGNCTNNPDGVSRLLNDGSLELVEYHGKLTPPDGVVTQDGTPMVFLVTSGLLEYVATKVGECQP